MVEQTTRGASSEATEADERTAARLAADDGRRRAPRFPFFAELEVVGSASASATGTVLDVSAGGLRAKLDKRVGVGRCATLLIRTPSDRVFRNSVQVVWTQTVEGGAITGFQFL